jgi:hypothetical protein
MMDVAWLAGSAACSSWGDESAFLGMFAVP